MKDKEFDLLKLIRQLGQNKITHFSDEFFREKDVVLCFLIRLLLAFFGIRTVKEKEEYTSISSESDRPNKSLTYSRVEKEMSACSPVLLIEHLCFL